MTTTIERTTAGSAIVEFVGLDDDGRHTARLFFPNGAPAGFTFAHVWDATPVRLVLQDSHDDLVKALESFDTFARMRFSELSAMSPEMATVWAEVKDALGKARAP